MLGARQISSCVEHAGPKEFAMTDKNAPEPVDNVSIKSGNADRTADGFGKGEGYSGDEYDSADHAAERHLQNRDGA